MSYRKFQILRGNKANLPTLSDGEMAFCSDTKELYIGSGGTNRRIGDSETAYGVATGTNSYAVTVDKQLSGYTAGLMVNFLVQNVNTTATTLNVNGLGVKNIYKNVDEPVSAGSFRAGQIVSVVYDGTNFQLLSGSGGGISLPVYDNVVTNTSTNTVVFNILGFDSTRDVLLVYANSTFIQVNADYSISGSSIVKTSGTWASGTIFNFVCFQMVDGTPDGLGIANIDSSFTATANGTTNCSLNTANYNPLSDILYVYYQNIILFEGVDYTVSVDGMSITLTSFTINTGEVLRYKILKKVRQNLYETDGSMIQDGTVGNAKLATDIKIGSLASLTTDNKTTVVSAINEIDNNLNSVQSMFAEGSWIPALYGANSGSFSYVSQSGRYVKIGRLVVVQGLIALQSATNLSGALSIVNLPFPISSTKNNIAGVSHCAVAYCNIPSGYTNVSVQNQNASTNLNLLISGSTNISFDVFQANYLTANSGIRFTHSYFTD